MTTLQNPPRPSLPPSCRVRYEAIRPIASGSMGRVVLARDLTLGREVVIKVLRSVAIDDADRYRRFTTEARLTMAFSHPNLVTLLDQGVDGRVPWIVYEFVPEGDLQSWCDRGAELPWQQAVIAVCQVASALALAHAKGIVHRDVKPSNILRARHSLYKLADFGLAKWRDSGVLTAAGVRVGTPASMSPEQIRGEPATPASDVYGLGATLHFLLTRRFPYEGPQMQDVLDLHLNGEVPRLEALRQDLPPGLPDVVARCLAKDPARRYATADELRRALIAATRKRLRTSETLALDPSQCERDVADAAVRVRDLAFAARERAAALVARIWPPDPALHSVLLFVAALLALGLLGAFAPEPSVLWTRPPGGA